MVRAKKWRQKLSGSQALALSIVECQTPGAAAAKNYGAAKAHGQYLWFIDADDTIAREAVAKLITEARRTGANLVMLGAERIYIDGHRDYLSAVCPSEPDYKSRFVRYGMGPWQVFIERAWWRAHKLGFREGIIHEDMELMSVLILHAKTYAAVDEPLYFYHQTPNSVLHRPVWSEHAYDIFPALEGLYARFKALHAEIQYHDELEWFFIWNLLIDSAQDFAAFPEGRPGFARSRQMLRHYYPHWRRNRFFRVKPLKFRLRCLLNYYK